MKIKSDFTNPSSWTNVRGWDSATKTYIDLDCEGWIRENRIREVGRENGEQEFPRTQASQPDDIYAKILDWVEKRARTCHTEISKYLQQLHYQLMQESSSGTAPIQDKVMSLRSEGEIRLVDQSEEDRTMLTQQESETREAWRALEKFREEAKLDRVVEYEGRETWYWWLIGIIVIEGLANAFMLSGVHEYGLLGSMIIMLSISVINAVFIGFLIGEGWRKKNSIKSKPRSLGWTMVAGGFLCTLLWNLLVGHFRDSSLAVAAEAASGANSLADLLGDDTIPRFLASPLGLEGMQSWVLAIVGMGCCAIAAYKWLARDDDYPGYGSLHRTATDHNEEYKREIRQRRQRLENIYKHYIDRIRDEKQLLENRKGNHSRLTNEAKAILTQFPMHLAQYQNNLDSIIAAYRSENEKARTSPPPAFFGERPLIDKRVLQAPEWEDVLPPDHSEDWEVFQLAEKSITQAYRNAQVGYPTLEDLFEGERARDRLAS